MNIQENLTNFKRFSKGSDLHLAFLIVAVGLGSFLLGRASVSPTMLQDSVFLGEMAQDASIISTREEGGEMQIVETIKTPRISEDVSGAAAREGGYVASKSGAKYHLPWCSGAKRIKEENKVWFKTKAEAEAAGYEPAANCKGI